MNMDKYDEVINGNDTYKKIADTLVRKNKSCIIAWSDGGYDHRDILFSYKPRHLGGTLQRGLRWCFLYVSIMDFSCMGFLIENDKDNRKHNCYIQEKLRLANNHCDLEICDLINGVIHEIDKLEENIL